MVRASGELHATVKKALELHNKGEGWTFVKDADGIRFSDKASPWCNKKAVYFETIVNAPLQKVQAFLSQPGDVEMKDRNIFKFDELLEHYEVVQRIDDDTQVVHTCYKSPFFGVSPRDVVTLSHECVLTPEEVATYGFQKGDQVFIQASYSQSDAVPEKKGYVRGESHAFSIIVVQHEGNPSQCDLKLVMSFDPSGMIPAKVVELSASNQMKKLFHIRTYAQNS